MTNDNVETDQSPDEFDFSSLPVNALIHDRRTGHDRRRRQNRESPGGDGKDGQIPSERRAKTERRRRIDPTTYEKQYTDDELEFMNAMQRFKELSGKAFPTHGDIIRVAVELGYRLAIVEPEPSAQHSALSLGDR